MWQSNFLTVLFFWVFSCAFCIGLLWSPPVYCVKVASLLCRSRWFTVLKSPVYCVEVAGLLCRSHFGLPPVYCVEVAGLPPFYHVEVAGLLCRSHLGLPLVYCVEVVSLLCRSRRFTM